jgi:hypothetical protein
VTAPRRKRLAVVRGPERSYGPRARNGAESDSTLALVMSSARMRRLTEIWVSERRRQLTETSRS